MLPIEEYLYMWYMPVTPEKVITPFIFGTSSHKKEESLIVSGSVSLSVVAGYAEQSPLKFNKCLYRPSIIISFR